MIGQRIIPCIVIEEHKATIPVGSRDGAHGGPICGVGGYNTGQDRSHRGKRTSKFVEEQVKYLGGAKRRAHLSELSQGRLEVIGDFWQIVNMIAGNGFLKAGQLAFRIGAALIHVVAIQVGARTQSGQSDGGDVIGTDHGAAVVGDLHSPARFGHQVRIFEFGR